MSVGMILFGCSGIAEEIDGTMGGEWKVGVADEDEKSGWLPPMEVD